jgi:RsbRD-like negative regulator of sigma factor
VSGGAATAGLLAANRASILDDAADALGRTHSSHYERAGEAEVRSRLESLFDRLVRALARHDVAPVVVYAQEVAEQRFRSGFDLSEVQSAFNALEEVVWARMLAELPPAELAEALGLVSTVLGAGKDALARRYVSLAAQTHAPSLDLSALFTGIES